MLVLVTRTSDKIIQCKLFYTQSRLLISFFLVHSLFTEKERELCVRERLAEDKLARADSLLKNYSLLKEHKFLSLASRPGVRVSSVNRSCCR